MSGEKKDCCKLEDNLKVQPSDGRPELLIRKCIVCGCRHIELSLDPGIIGLEGTKL